MSHSTPPQFQIKNEGLAARCEVCHQEDQFNPESGYCRRCGYLTGEKSSSQAITQYRNIGVELELMSPQIYIFSGIGLCVAFVAGAYWESQWIFIVGTMVLLWAISHFQQKKKEKIDRCPECGGVFPIGDADREGIYCRYCGVRLRA